MKKKLFQDIFSCYFVPICAVLKNKIKHRKKKRKKEPLSILSPNGWKYLYATLNNNALKLTIKWNNELPFNVIYTRNHFSFIILHCRSKSSRNEFLKLQTHFTYTYITLTHLPLSSYIYWKHSPNPSSDKD